MIKLKPSKPGPISKVLNIAKVQYTTKFESTQKQTSYSVLTITTAKYLRIFTMELK